MRLGGCSVSYARLVQTRTELIRSDPATAVQTRLLRESDELEQAAAIVLSVWGEEATTLASPQLLRTYAHFGNPVVGAQMGDELCGVSVGFLAPGGGVHLHSHITGVKPNHQGCGVGYALKTAQRRWCLDNAVDLVTWTFDPLLSRNAYFNMHKLGARSHELLPGFYGEMDDQINGGDVTDRLSVTWSVRSESVAAALAGEVETRNDVVRSVTVPPDYHRLRRESPATALRWRAEVRDELIDAFATGLEVVDFHPNTGYALANR